MPTCKTCQTLLPPKRRAGRCARYCCASCRQKNYLKRKRHAKLRHFVTVATDKKPLQNATKDGPIRVTKSRNPLPHVLSSRRRIRRTSRASTCQTCQQTLPTPKTAGRKRAYCSDACRQQAYRKRQSHLNREAKKAAQNPLKSFIHTSIEWHTPAEYIQAVKDVLGDIELDPASCAVANETVQAKRYFDRVTNGLEQEWKGRIYLNPPHDRRNTVQPWVSKLLQEFRQGNVGEAILLIDAATETGWFHALYDFAMCFVRGRIHFINGDGQSQSGQIQGSVFVYLGQKTSTFVRVFEKIGRIYVPFSLSPTTL